ncbi:hypothetical protein SDC9_149033 [bioreactor metagenome]|uniref:Uncharacterized protein n=1 Tax=bioreactor metagenome TaxID=1076179 RepID=A0A645EIP7_9ZZZZ
MPHCLGQAEHGCKAGVAAFKQRAPVRLGLGADEGRDALLQRWPRRRVVLVCRVHVRQAQLGQQQCVERRLDRAEADEAAVGADVHVIERRIVERARLCAVDLPVGANPVHQRAQHGHDVHDGCVHNPATAGGPCIDQRAGDAKSHA